MKPNASSIINEALRSSEVELRKNAVTALAVLGGDEGIARLTDIAFSDEDPSVRTRAEDEILQLQPDSAKSAVACIQRFLSDPQRRQTAYILSGKMRNRGITISKPPVSFFVRIRLALSASRQLVSVKDATFRLRAAKSAIFGGILGLLLLGLAVVAESGHNFTEENSTIVLTMVLSWILLGLSVSQRRTGLGLQLYPGATIFVELGYAIWAGILADILILVLLALMRVQALGDIALGKFLCKLPFFVAIVRLGSISSLGIFSSRAKNRVAQTLTGAAAGIIFLTVIPLIWGGVDNSYAQFSWSLLVSVSLALGAVYAQLDSESPVGQPFLGKAGFAASLVLVSVILVGALIGIPRVGASSDSADLDGDVVVADEVKGADFEFEVKESKVGRRIRLPNRESLFVSSDNIFRDYFVDVRDQNDHILQRRPYLSLYFPLNPGDYTIVVGHESAGLLSILPTLVNQGRSRLKIPEPAAENNESVVRVRVILRPINMR